MPNPIVNERRNAIGSPFYQVRCVEANELEALLSLHRGLAVRSLHPRHWLMHRIHEHIAAMAEEQALYLRPWAGTAISARASCDQHAPGAMGTVAAEIMAEAEREQGRHARQVGILALHADQSARCAAATVPRESFLMATRK